MACLLGFWALTAGAWVQSLVVELRSCKWCGMATIKKEKLVRRVVFFHIFANLLKAWLNRMKLDSPICFFTRSVEVSLILWPLENSTVYSGANESQKAT